MKRQKRTKQAESKKKNHQIEARERILESQHGSKKRFSGIRFLTIYLCLMVLIALAMSLEVVKKVIDINGIYTTLIIKATAFVLKPFELVQGINGSIIHLKGISLNVKFGCNGLEAFLIYMVAILAFPSSWKKKLIGILGGFLVIQFFNILRIAALGYCGVHFSKYFYIFHIYVAQGIMIAIAFATFIIWLGYVNEK